MSVKKKLNGRKFKDNEQVQIMSACVDCAGWLRLFRNNPLQNNKFFNVTKLKAFADDKLNVAKIMIVLFDREENTLGKGENAGYQHFLLFPQCFQSLLL